MLPFHLLALRVVGLSELMNALIAVCITYNIPIGLITAAMGEETMMQLDHIVTNSGTTRRKTQKITPTNQSS